MIQSALPLEQRAIVSAPHVGPVLCVRYNATGEYVLTGGQDRTIQLWNLSKSKHIKQYAGPHGREVKDVQIAPSSDRFCSCGGDRNVMLWDISTGECTRRLRGHESAVNSMSYSSDGSLLCSGGADMALKLWDLRAFSKDAVQSMTDARDSVTAVLMRDTTIYAASMDGCVRRYDVRKANRTTDHIATPVSSLTLSHDGNCLLLSCLDSTYRLLDVASGVLLNEYTGARAVEYRMEGAFDAADAHVTGGSEDGSIVVWELVEAKLMQPGREVQRASNAARARHALGSSALLLGCFFSFFLSRR